jgi:hypothetical protein
VAQRPGSGLDGLSVEILRTYTTHHTRQDSSGRGIGPSQRPIPDNTQQSPYIYAPAGTRTRNPTTRAAAAPRLRPRGHWVRPTTIIATLDLTDTILPSLLTYATRFGFRPHADDHHLRTVRPIYTTGVPLPSRCCILYIFPTNIRTLF